MAGLAPARRRTRGVPSLSQEGTPPGFLGVPDRLVRQAGDAAVDRLGVYEAQRLPAAGLAEHPPAGAEHDREDLEPQFVHQVVLEQRADELEAAGNDEIPVEAGGQL